MNNLKKNNTAELKISGCSSLAESYEKYYIFYFLYFIHNIISAWNKQF